MITVSRVALVCASASLVVFQLAGCGGGPRSAVVEKQAQLFPNPPEEPAKPQVAAVSEAVNAGVPIEVELSDVMDSDTSPVGGFIHARVTENVKGKDGQVAIPAGVSGVVLIVGTGKEGGDSWATLALYQLTIGDRSFLLTHGSKHLATLEFRENSAKGDGHRSVHLQKGAVLRFVLSEPLGLKK